MQTRQDAIDFFLSQGYDAKARDWSLGETIVVPFGPNDRTGEISLYSRVLWLYPVDQEWSVCYPLFLQDDLKFSTLGDAVIAAQQFIKQYEQSAQ